MYGKSVIRESGVALLLVIALSGLLAAAVSGGSAWNGTAPEAAGDAVIRQEALPMLPEIVVTASRLEA